jgi:phospholipid/cholesterol/gamma-HCH transport system ATP-binding protein
MSLQDTATHRTDTAVYEDAYAEGNVAEPAHGLAHSVKIMDVKKSFGSFDVLTGLNLNFVDDAITTILGPSGTGKSVLLKHIVGLLEPDSGVIEVFGKDIWKISDAERRELRKRFGVLFQDGALFGSMNIYDNVAFPLRKHTRKRESEIRQIVMENLDEVGLTAAIGKMPGEVSGGMKKRAGFARALVLKPSVVMFDEPDSGLDPVRTSLLNDLILKVHAEHGGTYVLVTHDIRTARKVSDYVGVLWKGKLIHYGEAEEAFKSEMPFVRQFLSGDSVGPLGMD